MPHLSERQNDPSRNFAITLYSLHHALFPICHHVLPILLPKYLSDLSLLSIFWHQFPSSLKVSTYTRSLALTRVSVTFPSLAHTQRGAIYFANYICPVYNLSVPPTSYISGNKSKFCTLKPFIVHQSPLPLCSTTCGDPRNKDPRPDVPTSSRVFCLKCPTSSSVFPQTALSSNANL